MRLIKTLLLAVSLLASPVIALAADILIEQPYIRVSSPISKSGAGFMQITNNSSNGDVLLSVTTDAARMPELHTHIMQDGVAMMRQVEGGIVIEAGETTMLQRGGLHVMLMGLTRSLNHGDTVTLTLVFQNAGEITLDVPVDNERQGPEATHSMNN